MGAAIQTALLCYLVITSVPINDCHCENCEIDNSVQYKKAIELRDNPSPLKFYSLAKFAQRGWMFPLDSKLCVPTKNVAVSALEHMVSFGMLG